MQSGAWHISIPTVLLAFRVINYASETGPREFSTMKLFKTLLSAYPKFRFDPIGGLYPSHDGMGKPPRASPAGAGPLRPLNGSKDRLHGESRATTRHGAAIGIGCDRQPGAHARCQPT